MEAIKVLTKKENMEKFQFISFEPTPGEKHVGILTVRIFGSVVIVLRYKIVAKKDGSGYFPTCASYKMPNRMPSDEYDECFMLDSRVDNDQLIKFMMGHFHQWQKAQPVANSTPFIQRPEYQVQPVFQQATFANEASVNSDHLPF